LHAPPDSPATGGTLVAVTWLSQTEISLREAINASRDDIEDKQDRMTREFGETVTAIRQKVHEIETWARDEFVRKGSFDIAMGRVEKMLGDQFDRIEIRMDRMEKKIDDKIK
jgi:signal transduction protein with GAF and PtsI domain